MVSEDRVEVGEYRAALRRLLDSELFTSSRRLSDFCLYSGQAALEGRTELDQYEIADKVLGRTTDFDPWDNAAVRKLATQLRHKLEEYYAGPGASDRIIVFLPRRSYVLRFRRREDDPAPVAMPVSPPASVLAETPVNEDLQAAIETAPLDRASASRPVRWTLLTGLLLAAGLAFFLIARYWPRPQSDATSDPPRIIINTQGGDLRGKQLDVASGAVRIGPVLGEGEDAIVRLRITPEYPTQQAGLMAMYDADNYVRVGPHFKNRTFLEFGFEHEGTYHGPESTYTYDPLGAAGQPRWLALRRTGPNYQAFLGQDGFFWSQFGSALVLPDTSGDLHAAVYAFNGRSAVPSVVAVFDHLGSGPAFHNRVEGPLQPGLFPGWRVRQECGNPVSATIAGGMLHIGFAVEASGCSWTMSRAAPEGDWAFSTLVDFEAVSGSAFGVEARGSKGSMAMTRRDLDGRSIQLEQRDDRDTRIPDYPGTPPVLLRIEKRGDILRGMASRDLETFTVLPGQVRLSDLGELQSIGVITSVAHWTSEQSRPPARVYWMRTESLTPGFLSTRNVP